MKAAVVRQIGQPPVLTEFPTAEARDGEVRVAMTAAALSPLARVRAAGTHYSTGGTVPFVAGVDGVGRLSDGSRVYVLLPRAPQGTMAEEVVIDADRCVPVPEDLDDVSAAVLPNPGMSSWAALVHRARIRPGETVLVNGATGASGRLAVRIARHLGAAKVIATGRNRSVLGSLDADVAICLEGDELSRALPEQFAAGVDVVLDYLWGSSALDVLRAHATTVPLDRALRFVQIGASSGGEIEFPASILRSSAVELMGSGLGSVSTKDLLSSIAGVFEVAISASLTVETKTAPLAKVAETWNDPEGTARLVYISG